MRRTEALICVTVFTKGHHRVGVFPHMRQVLGNLELSSVSERRRSSNRSPRQSESNAAGYNYVPSLPNVLEAEVKTCDDNVQFCSDCFYYILA